MCSSPKCDMAELINGPVGNLVGMGIKALFERAASRSPGPQRNCELSSDKEKIKKFYDNVEAHLQGTLRVLEPALQINRMIVRECRSAGHDNNKRVEKQNCELVYYTPQNSKKIGKRCGREGSTKCCGDERMREHQRERSTPRRHSQYSNDSIATTSTLECSKYKSPPKMRFSPEKCKKVNEKSRELSNRRLSQKSGCSSKRACSICGIKLRENSILAKLPCAHLFCYSCLGKAKYPRKCQICNESFTMKNIIDITDDACSY